RITFEDFQSDLDNQQLTAAQNANLDAATQEAVAAVAQEAYQNDALLHAHVMQQLVEIDRRQSKLPGQGSVYRIVGRLEGQVPTHHLLTNSQTVGRILRERLQVIRAEIEARGPEQSPQELL